MNRRIALTTALLIIASPFAAQGTMGQGGPEQPALDILACLTNSGQTTSTDSTVQAVCGVIERAAGVGGEDATDISDCLMNNGTTPSTDPNVQAVCGVYECSENDGETASTDPQVVLVCGAIEDASAVSACATGDGTTSSTDSNVILACSIIKNAKDLASCALNEGETTSTDPTVIAVCGNIGGLTDVLGIVEGTALGVLACAMGDGTTSSTDSNVILACSIIKDAKDLKDCAENGGETTSTDAEVRFLCSLFAPDGDLAGLLASAADAVQSLLNRTVAASGGQPGPDRDEDGRPDYYWVNQSLPVPVGARCAILQSDFLWDGETASGSGSDFSTVPQDGSGLPAPGESNTRVTGMVYVSAPQAGAACDSAPDLEPTLRPTGHVAARLDPAGVGAPEDNATFLVLYDDADEEIYRVEVFTRSGTGKNDGIHVVLRSQNPAEIDPCSLSTAAIYQANCNVFMVPFDLTNIHIVSGLKTSPAGDAANSVRNHDFDDDGVSDALELTWPVPGYPQKMLNPLNDRSTTADWDGDGIPNPDDSEPTEAGAGWIVDVTAPDGSGLVNGTTTIEWTADRTSAAAPDIANFRILVGKVDATGAFTTGWPVVLAEDLPGAAGDVSRSFVWDTHATRNATGLLTTDGNFRVIVEGNFSASTLTASDASATFTVRNFQSGAYDLPISGPSTGQTLNGTVGTYWNVTAEVADPLPIDHFDVDAVVEHAAHAQGTDHGVGVAHDHNWTIAHDVPASARSATWDTVAWRLANQQAGGGGNVRPADHNLKIKIFAADKPTGNNPAPMTFFNKSGQFTLRNTPAPLVAGLAVADNNTFIDNAAGGFTVTGALDVQFTLTSGRPDAADRGARVEIYRCTDPATPTQEGAAPLVATLWYTNLRAGSTNLTVPEGVIRQQFGDGAFVCNPGPTNTGELQSPLANDGRGRVRVQLWEVHEGLNSTSGVNGADSRKDFRAYHNTLPTASNLNATQLDVGGQTSLGAVKSRDVKFDALVKDNDIQCLAHNPHTSVTLRLYRADGSLFASIPMARSQAFTGDLMAHIQSCARFDLGQPWNSNSQLGVLYTAILTEVPEGLYNYNVSVVDKFGNVTDGVAGNSTSPTATLTVEADGPNDPFGPLDSTVEAVEGAIGCDLPFDGEDDSDLPDCHDRPASQFDAVVNALEGLAGCDIDNDGLPMGARECEDLSGIVTNALNAGINQTGDLANDGLPNPFGCAIPGDTDGDCSTDAEETAFGTDPFNPYSNLFDADADLVLNALEPGLTDVNLYRIDWVRHDSANQSTKCHNGTSYYAGGCVGKVNLLPSPQKYLRLGPNPGYVLRIEERAGTLVVVSTAQQDGLTWTVVDGLLGLEVEGRRIHAVANFSDGRRAVEVTIDLARLGAQGKPMVVAQVFGQGGVGNVAPPAEIVEVYTNPANVTQSGDGQWPEALPRVGTFLDERGLPVLWVDEDGDGSYDEGEEVSFSPPEDAAEAAEAIAACVQAEGSTNSTDGTVLLVCGAAENAHAIVDCAQDGGNTSSTDPNVQAVCGVIGDVDDATGDAQQAAQEVQACVQAEGSTNSTDSNVQLVCGVVKKAHEIIDCAQDGGNTSSTDPNVQAVCGVIGDVDDATQDVQQVAQDIRACVQGDGSTNSTDPNVQLLCGAVKKAHEVVDCAQDGGNTSSTDATVQAVCSVIEDVDDATGDAQQAAQEVQACVQAEGSTNSTDSNVQLVCGVVKKAHEIIDCAQDGGNTSSTDPQVQAVCDVIENAVAATDVDGDGYDNLEEIQANSNPFYAGSTPDQRGRGWLPKLNQTNPGNSNAGDWDADGWLDNQELTGAPQRSNPFQACSTPTDPNGWPTSPSCE